MEAYCNAMHALEEKFYSIELNHVHPPSTMRRQTNSQRLRQGESPFPECFRARHNKAVRRPRAAILEPEGTLGSSLESSGHGARE
jgi:hypothetical protein